MCIWIKFWYVVIAKRTPSVTPSCVSSIFPIYPFASSMKYPTYILDSIQYHHFTIWLSWWWALYEKRVSSKNNIQTHTDTLIFMHKHWISAFVCHTHARTRSSAQGQHVWNYPCRIYRNIMFSLVLSNIGLSRWPPTAFIFLDDLIVVVSDFCMIYSCSLPCACVIAVASVAQSESSFFLNRKSEVSSILQWNYFIYW